MSADGDSEGIELAGARDNTDSPQPPEDSRSDLPPADEQPAEPTDSPNVSDPANRVDVPDSTRTEGDSEPADKIGADKTEDVEAPSSEPLVEPPGEPETGTVDTPADVAASPMQWYVLRVASNREDQVCTALKRKVTVEHLDDRIGRILVPSQREKRMRGRVAKVINRKLYPGYVFVEMATEEDGSIPEDIWFMIKETMSVGDFIGSDGKPTAMKPHDVEKMLAVVEKSAEQPTLAGMAGMKKGDAIKVKEGPFENFEGEIDEVMPDKGQVRVIVSIFGRPTPIELEYWQIELT